MSASCLRSYSAKTIFLLVSLTVLLLTGCAGKTPKTPEQKFVAQIDTFVAELMAQQPIGAASSPPVAVMPASLIFGGKHTRLEEYVVNRLTTHLRQSHEIYSPSRENWFEIRERQPLTFAGQPDDKRSYLDNIIVYQVAVTNDDVLKQVTVQATAIGADSKPIPGVLTETNFPTVDRSSPAMLQYQAKPKSSALPEGLEERPFSSMDRMAYSLASELASAYQANVSGRDSAPANSEVKVVLQTRSVNRAVGDGFLQQLESSLQQAFVSKKGFTCAVSQKDFAPTFDQVDFYRKNYQTFEMDESLLSAGSVVLLAEAFPHKDSGKVGVNLRSLWRVAPLDDNQGKALSNNLGGTYLSGFAAKAYLEANSKTLSSGGSSKRSYRPARTSYGSQPVGSRGFD